jgi:FG-GAP-like repeat/IPT/TIG domain
MNKKRLTCTKAIFLLGALTANAWAWTPFIDILSPPSAAPGQGALSLTIRGANFIQGAHVNFNGVLLTPNSLTANRLQVTVPAASLAKAGTANVTVVNPDTAPLQGTSNVAFFPITNATASVSFAAMQNYVTPAQVSGFIFAGDFNGDGHLDLAAAGDIENQEVGPQGVISILLGDGEGNFSMGAGFQFASNFSPIEGIALGDFNADGKLDLAVSLVGGVPGYPGSIAILLGDGSGGFSSLPLIPFNEKGSYPGPMVTGDFNGDGKLDLAVGDQNGNVTMLLGDGTGGFATGSLSPTTSMYGVWSLVAGDLNGDGELDLAAVSFAYYATGDLPLNIFPGDGRGNFFITNNPPLVAPQLMSLAAGDFNGDGAVDLLVTTYTGEAFVMINNGMGLFSEGGSLSLGAPANSGQSAAVAGDFNGDGKLDVAVAIITTTGPTNMTVVTNLTILLGDGTGHFSPVVFPAVPAIMNQIATGDFNGDGRLDIASANNDGTVSILLQTDPPASVCAGGAAASLSPAAPSALPAGLGNPCQRMPPIVLPSARF